MLTLTQLRKLAELNLCPSCFDVYKAILEPSIRQFVLNPLSDWRGLESSITQMVMRNKGVFKSETIFISIDENEESKFVDEVDVVAFRKIEKWPFKGKIDYLHRNGILQNVTYTYSTRSATLETKFTSGQRYLSSLRKS